MLSTTEKRKHAELLAARDSSVMAQAQVGLLRAEADLDDALADREPATAEHCYIVREYPIIGKCGYEGGKLVEIERPWTDAQIAACKAAGIDIAFQWTPDPACGLNEGELIRIWIGTREAGPRLQWDSHTGKWLRLRSNGNYGKNWACGGIWREDKPITQREHNYYDTLAEAAPDLAEIIENTNHWTYTGDTRPIRHDGDEIATDQVLHDMAVEDAMDEFDD